METVHSWEVVIKLENTLQCNFWEMFVCIVEKHFEELLSVEIHFSSQETNLAVLEEVYIVL